MFQLPGVVFDAAISQNSPLQGGLAGCWLHCCKAKSPADEVLILPCKDKLMGKLKVSTDITHPMISPDGPVETENDESGGRGNPSGIDCSPSEKSNETGVTVAFVKLGGSTRKNTRDPVTLSDVVLYIMGGDPVADVLVKRFPV